VTPERQARVRYEYHRPGKGVTVYPERLVADRSDVKILLMEGHKFPDVIIGGRVVLEHRAPSVWFVFPGAWSDVGRFHLADGTFTGWYTNLCTPVATHERTWSSTDLFLDHWMPVDGEPYWTDRDEFGRAIASGLLDEGQIQRALAEQDRIQELVSIRAWPPPVCRDVDLAWVLRHAGTK